MLTKKVFSKIQLGLWLTRNKITNRNETYCIVSYWMLDEQYNYFYVVCPLSVIQTGVNMKTNIYISMYSKESSIFNCAKKGGSLTSWIDIYVAVNRVLFLVQTKLFLFLVFNFNSFNRLLRNTMKEIIPF